jgi:hypothetical protein
MRFIFALLGLFAGVIGYGAYRQHQVQVAREQRAAALQDSLRRADSLEQLAQARAAERERLAAREAAALGARELYEERQADRPKPLKLQKAKTRVVYVTKPPPNRPR